MQTGLTSFLDKMIARSGNKPATGDPAQKSDDKTGQRAGQGTGEAIALEFARMIRALRAETQSGVSRQGADSNPDEGSSAEGEADEKTDIASLLARAGVPMSIWGDDETGDGSDGKDDGDANSWRLSVLRSLAEGDADASQALSGDANAEAVVVAAASQFGLRVSAGDPATTTDGGDGEVSTIAAGAGRSGAQVMADGAAPRETVTDTDGKGGLAEDGPSASRPAFIGQARPGVGADEHRERSGQGDGPAHQLAARGAGHQVHVEVVSAQTHLPPTSPAPSTVQLLGKSIGEAVNELANTRISGGASNDSETTRQEVSRRLVIELQPREYGSVRVSLVKQAGELRIEIIPMTDKANDLLNSHRDALAHSIRHAGTVVTEISVRMSHDGGMGRDFQSGQNPAFNWNGGTGGSGGSGESGGGTRQNLPQDNQGGQQWQQSESRPETDRPSRNGIYL